MFKKLALRLAAIPAFFAATAGYALAALPEAVSTEVATYRTDMLALFALLIAAGVAIWGAQKLGRKMGWL